MNATSDLILTISPRELNQIKSCVTRKEVWDVLLQLAVILGIKTTICE